MAAAVASSRKLIKEPAGLAAATGLGFGPGSAAGDDALPWDVIEQKLAELLRFMESAVQAFVAALREHAAALLAALDWLVRVVLPVAAAVVVLLFVCGCCCVAAAAQRRQRRGPDGGEEVEGLDGDIDGPVVRYHGVYKGGVFSMHPNKPIVG